MNDINKDQYPVFQCHKKVNGFKIGKIVRDLLDFRIVPARIDLPELQVSEEYIKKHNPKAGGYVVFYDDDYVSYSPAAPFENGYTEVTE